MWQSTRQFIRPAAIALVAVAILACAEGVSSPAPAPNQPTPPTPPTTPVVASVSLDVEEISLEEGAIRQLIATPRDASGKAIEGLYVSWSSSDPSVAEVGALGRVTGVRVGTTEIIAGVQGKIARAAVVVRADYPFDLLYSVRTFDIFHELFRLDVRHVGAAPTRLFPAQQWAAQAKPSPDGSRIAYVCPNPIIGDPSICVANRDGSGSAMVVAFISDVFAEPAWSPDGARLAYVRSAYDGRVDRWHIWIANADGTNQEPLTTGMPGNQTMPAWSRRLPDGTERIAFVQDVNAQPRIWTMHADGSGLRQLGSMADARDIQPAWSPDGRTIAFQRTTASIASDIWLMAADGADERPLMAASLDGPQLSPSWSPDGRLIAFASRHDGSAGSAFYQVYSVWRDGTRLARRTFDAVDKATPTWVPMR